MTTAPLSLPTVQNTKFKIVQVSRNTFGNKTKNSVSIGSRNHNVTLMKAQDVRDRNLTSNFKIFHYSSNAQGQYGHAGQRDTYFGLKRFCIQVRASN